MEKSGKHCFKSYLEGLTEDSRRLQLYQGFGIVEIPRAESFHGTPFWCQCDIDRVYYYHAGGLCPWLSLSCFVGSLYYLNADGSRTISIVLSYFPSFSLSVLSIVFLCDYNLFTFLPSFFSIQTFPYTSLHSLLNSLSLFSLTVIACTHIYAYISKYNQLSQYNT